LDWQKHDLHISARQLFLVLLELAVEEVVGLKLELEGVVGQQLLVLV
jgi:hypothetical protein